jgi:hypothetical protein
MNSLKDPAARGRHYDSSDEERSMENLSNMSDSTESD